MDETYIIVLKLTGYKNSRRTSVFLEVFRLKSKSTSSVPEQRLSVILGRLVRVNTVVVRGRVRGLEEEVLYHRKRVESMDTL